MDMVTSGFVSTLKASLEDGKISLEEIDQACRRILEAKYKLGLFADPYRYIDLQRPERDIYTAEHRKEARRLAAESFVLLKNEKSLLPLSRSQKIALIGPLADTRANMPGTWSVAAVSDKYRTLREAMAEAVGSGNLLYAKGCNLMYDADYEANATMFGREMRTDRPADEMRKEALKIARKADVIVFAGGESSEMTGESSCRTNLEMPDAQRDLLEQLLATGKPIVLLNFSGRPVVLNWEAEHLPAILQVWFGGSEAADAICDVVFGEVSPSGKLTTQFPRSVGQLPFNYSHFNTGRPQQDDKFVKFKSNYLDSPNSPLYPFGYGLSYTTFGYSPVRLSATEMDEADTLRATVTVTNTGSRAAEEVVQMYLRDVVGSVVRPVKELKGFQRIALAPGESRDVTFDISADLLRFYRPNPASPDAMELVAEPGEFQVMIGSSSEDLKSATFQLTGPRRLSILAIGNSFSEDAVEQNLWEIARDRGYDLTIGNVCHPGCSLERHAANVRSDSADYDYRKIVGGVKQSARAYTVSRALTDEPWDYVSLQQASHFSGQPSTYEPFLSEVIDTVRSATSARLVWHATWAYAEDSNHGGFAAYGNSQRQMYDSIQHALRQAVLPHAFARVVPAGAAVQYARSTPLGDTLCRDGFHLSPVGRYCVALTWAGTLLGIDVRQVGWHPEGVSAQQAAFARQAAYQACTELVGGQP